MDGLLRNRARVLSRIEDACRSVGRDPAEVRLVAVTKAVDCELAGALHATGCHELGENRLTEFERKHAWFAAAGREVRWHFIGHVQRNKARRVLRLADELHSVDSLRLFATLARLAEEEGRAPGIYLQVKLNDEAAKTGLAPGALRAAVERVAQDGRLPLLGLMTMAPLVEAGRARSEAARTFTALAELAERLPGDAFRGGRPLLSMGMSGDFEEAVHAGAHLVRVGSALFEGLPPRAPQPGGSVGR